MVGAGNITGFFASVHVGSRHIDVSVCWASDPVGEVTHRAAGFEKDTGSGRPAQTSMLNLSAPQPVA